MRRRDVLVAAGCGALSIGTFLLVPAMDETGTTAARGEPGWWVVIATLLAQAALLPWARHRPRAVLVATAGLALVAALAGAGDATSVATLAVVVATFVAALARPLGAVWPALAAATALVAVADAVGASDSGAAAAVGGAVVQAVGTLGLTLLVATLVAARREARSARQDEARALASEQEALVRAAIAQERTAMARELHDIAAHHLSGIAVMAAAIGRQVDSDPDGARAAAQQVRQQSTAVLRDLRSLVGLLRESDPGDARPETLAGIAALVADAASGGRDVRLTALGDTDGVGPLAQLAAYRAVQEGLANAARHAPGAPCEVTVDAREREAVVVSVRNGPGGRSTETGGGFGLIGMRERAELTGSTLDVGPTDDGGWQVALRVPREVDR